MKACELGTRKLKKHFAIFDYGFIGFSARATTASLVPLSNKGALGFFRCSRRSLQKAFHRRFASAENVAHLLGLLPLALTRFALAGVSAWTCTKDVATPTLILSTHCAQATTWFFDHHSMRQQAKPNPKATSPVHATQSQCDAQYPNDQRPT